MCYSKYCITECPIGTKAKDRILNEAESISDAVIDMYIFVDECIEKGCEFEKEKNAYTEE